MKNINHIAELVGATYDAKLGKFVLKLVQNGHFAHLAIEREFLTTDTFEKETLKNIKYHLDNKPGGRIFRIGELVKTRNTYKDFRMAEGLPTYLKTSRTNPEYQPGEQMVIPCTMGVEEFVYRHGGWMVILHDNEEAIMPTNVQDQHFKRIPTFKKD